MNARTDEPDADEDKRTLLRRHALGAAKQEAERRRKNPTQWYEIEIQNGVDIEATKLFIGGQEEGDVLITRGRKVVVPQTVIERLDDAVVGVAEADEEDPTKQRIVERRRFGYSILKGPFPSKREALTAAAA